VAGAFLLCRTDRGAWSISGASIRGTALEPFLLSAKIKNLIFSSGERKENDPAYRAAMKIGGIFGGI
jgi:hypothetical protein